MGETIVIDQEMVEEDRARFIHLRATIEAMASDANSKLEADGPDAEMVLKITRKTNAERTRVMPGVMGKVVQWGDGTWQFPTVVFVSAADVLKSTQKQLVNIDKELAMLNLMAQTKSVTFPAAPEGATR